MKSDVRIKYFFAGEETKKTYNKNSTLNLIGTYQTLVQTWNRLIRFEQQLKITLEDVINNIRPSTNTSTV